MEDVMEACEMFGNDFNFLPPYSPMPNPVEGCIGDVKRAIQTAFATVLRPARLNLASAPYDSFASLMFFVVWVSPLLMHDHSHEFSRPARMSLLDFPRSPTPLPVATASPSADPMARVDFRAMPMEPSTEIKQSSHILSFPVSGKILLMSLIMWVVKVDSVTGLVSSMICDKV
jgi:hypothetical protein